MKQNQNNIQILINKFNSKRFDEVINDALILLKKKENDFLWNLLGLSYQNSYHLQKSINCFENSIKLNPKNKSAYNNIGLSYKNLRIYPKAEENLLIALNLDENYIHAIVNLANVKNETYYFIEAISLYKRALKIEANNPLIHLNIANALQSLNDIEKTIFHLNEALRIDPLFTNADHKLSLLTKYEKNNAHLNEMLNKLNNIELNNTNKGYLYFAIAKAFEDLKDYDNSIKYLKLGNNLIRTNLRYNSNIHSNLVKKIKIFFEKIDYQKYIHKNVGANYIFILGMPRSGTSLIEKIISSHSKVGGLGETNFISDNIFNNIFKNLDSNNDHIYSFLNKNFSEEYKNFISYFNCKNEIIIDKTLSNFWCIGFIKIFFPNSKIIHSFRSQKDNCLSIYKNLFDTHEGWLYEENELNKYFLAYNEIMDYWNELFKDEILNFKYEKLIESPELQIKKLLSYCELDWEENCLNFHKNKNATKTLSINQTNKPLYNTSINKFELYEKMLPNLFKNLS